MLHSPLGTFVPHALETIAEVEGESAYAQGWRPTLRRQQVRRGQSTAAGLNAGFVTQGSRALRGAGAGGACGERGRAGRAADARIVGVQRPFFRPWASHRLGGSFRAVGDAVPAH